MKRFFTMLLAVAATTLTISCETSLEDLADDLIDDTIGGVVDDETEGKTAYTGEMEVSLLGITTYTNEEATFYAGVESEKISILMKGIQFDAAMPVTLDILISDIEMDGTSFSTDSIIPTVGGAEMADYVITSVEGSLDGDNFMVTFSCKGYDVVFANFSVTEESLSLYSGEMSVKLGDTVTYSDSNATFYASLSDPTNTTILINGVKFSDAMPETIDMQLMGLVVEDEKFSVDSIVPLVAGVEAENYTLTDVSGTLNSSDLTISFTYSVYTIEFDGSVNIEE